MTAEGTVIFSSESPFFPATLLSQKYECKGLVNAYDLEGFMSMSLDPSAVSRKPDQNIDFHDHRARSFLIFKRLKVALRSR